jgi:hypothetical protein
MEWVNVKDRLPELEQPVLVLNEYQDIWAAMRTDNEDGWLWASYDFGPLNMPDSYLSDDDYHFTHWMPLPKTIEEEKNE